MRVAFVFLVLTGFPSLASAQIWHVNSAAGSGADFPQITEAIEAANPGDTLYVAGSAVEYDAFTLAKPLVMIGPGYYLTLNQGLQAQPLAATVDGGGSVSVEIGASGSTFMGLNFEDRIEVLASNITFKRCRVFVNAVNSNVFALRGAANIIIAQSYIRNLGTNGTGLSISDNSTALISNSYMDGGGGSSAQIGNGLWIDASSTAVIDHSIIEEGFRCTTCTVSNSILITADLNVNGSSFSYTIFRGDNRSGEGNQGNVDRDVIFVDREAGFDAGFRLSPTSPARGAGRNGVDMGMFGGDEPYVLSGIPNIPSLYFFDAPISGSAANGLRVQVKARANN